MKKIISLLLALLMTFSVVTVAFATDAADETTTVAAEDTTAAPSEGGEGEAEGEPEEEGAMDFGEFQWILDLPFWTAKPALKFAKVALKLVSVYLKVAKIFGLVEEDMDDMIMGAIIDLIQQTQNSEEVEDTTAPVETTAAPVAPAA